MKIKFFSFLFVLIITLLFSFPGLARANNQFLYGVSFSPDSEPQYEEIVSGTTATQTTPMTISGTSVDIRMEPYEALTSGWTKLRLYSNSVSGYAQATTTGHPPSWAYASASPTFGGQWTVSGLQRGNYYTFKTLQCATADPTTCTASAEALVYVAPATTINVVELWATGGTWSISPGAGYTSTSNTVKPWSGGTLYTISVTPPSGYQVSSITNSNGGSTSMTLTPGQTKTFTINYEFTGPPPNQIPTVCAGPDKSITLPTNSVGVTSSACPTGAGATDPDGSITSTVWSFISGPATPSISGGSTLSPTFSNMTTAGTYVFRLTVNDNFSPPGVNQDDMQVVVNPSPGAMSGSLSGSSCTIASGASSCTTNLSWGIANPETTPTSITASGMTNINVTNTLSSPQSGVQPVTVTYPSRTFFLYNNAKSLVPTSPSGTGLTLDASCISGTIWNGLYCAISGGPAPIVSISANPTSGTAGVVNPALSWSVANSPTSCTASGDWGGSQATSGTNVSQGVLNTVKTYTYTLTCSNANGSGAGQATVVVSGDIPTAFISANPTSIYSGGSTILTWSTSYVSYCYASSNPANAQWDDSSTNKPTNGTKTITNLTATTNFQLYCPGPGGAGDANVTVTVNTAPDLTASVVSPTTATSGTALTFTSTISNTGSASTGSSFSNFFQVNNASGGTGGTTTDLSSSSMSALTAGANATATSPSYTFASTGTYSVRACADKTNSASSGTITESNEGNNCGGWTNVTVSAPIMYTLTINKAGTGAGTITSSPAGINCGADCAEDYTNNTSVVLTATPSTGSTLSSWTGTGCTTGTVSMTQARSCTANFTLNTYTVTPSISGTANGTISPNTPQSVDYGSTKAFTVTPNSGYSASMGGTCGGAPASGSSLFTYTTSPVTANCSVSVSFTQMTGTLTPASSSCTIALGASSCTSGTLTWTTTNPIATSAVTNNGTATPASVSGNNSSSSFTVPYNSSMGGVTTFYLYNNSLLLAQATVTTSCAVGSAWNGSICASVVNGALGTANGKTYPSGTTSYGADTQCAAGTSTNTAFPAVGGSVNWVCNGINGGTNSGAGTASRSGAMSGTLTPSTGSCEIASGASSCTINYSWTTTNPVVTPSSVTSDTNNSGASSPNFTVASGNSGGPTAFIIPFGGRNFYLYNNAILLASSSIASGSVTCVSGTTWNGTTCAVNPNPSGTISATSCTIAVGASTCNSTLNWTTANITPSATQPEVTKYSPPSTHVSYASSGTNISNAINYGDNAFFLYYQGSPLAASSVITVGCASGSNWNGSSCVAVAPSNPDLTSSFVVPSSATAGTPVSFSATIFNVGSASTGGSFSNFFQVSSTADGGGSLTDLSSTSMGALASGTSDTATSPAYIFPSSGTYSVRVCADKTSSGSSGTITESDESNNCSNTGWTNVTVGPAGSNLEVTPTASLSSAKVNQSVVWTCVASGGSGSYVSYEWGGSDIPDYGTASAPVANQYTIAYPTAGQKTATCTVTDSLGNVGVGTGSGDTGVIVYVKLPVIIEN